MFSAHCGEPGTQVRWVQEHDRLLEWHVESFDKIKKSRLELHLNS